MMGIRTQARATLIFCRSSLRRELFLSFRIGAVSIREISAKKIGCAVAHPIFLVEMMGVEPMSENPSA